jgi:hypothetical protein
MGWIEGGKFGRKGREGEEQDRCIMDVTTAVDERIQQFR